MNNIFSSFIDITRNIIFAKRVDVIFYYPQHFNRSAQGTNPFFDPLLCACDKAGISYKLIEEPDRGTDKPRNPKAIKGDFLYFLILSLRKILRLITRNPNFLAIEKQVARIIDTFSLYRFKAPYYVSISGSLNEFFLSLNPNGKVFEVQHGVIFAGKDSFFEPDGSLHPGYKNPRFNWLVWGQGYADSVMRGNVSIMKDRMFATGYPLALKDEFVPKSSFDDKLVLISVRFTTDFTQAELQQKKNNLSAFLDEMKDCGVKVLIKHHPRYNNVISLDDLFERHPFASVTNDSLPTLQNKIFLQVTTDSTTAFEYAETGILTFFYSNKDFMQKDNLFYKEYKYPLYFGMGIVDVINHLKEPENYRQDSITIRKWYDKFYTPFNEHEFLNILQTSND